MTNDALLQSMSLLDDGLVQEALTAKKKKRTAARLIPLAACLCLAVLAGFGVQRGWFADTAAPVAGYRQAAQPELSEREKEAPEISKSDLFAPSGQAGAAQPVFPSREGAPVKMVSSYGVGGAETACYKMPEDGFVGFSIPLHGAMEAYGDGSLFRVVVDMFSGDGQLEPDGERAAQEAKRLTALGYTVAVETVGNGEDERLRTFFTLHATYDQLQSFEAADDIGYMFFLYDERVHPEEG